MAEAADKPDTVVSGSTLIPIGQVAGTIVTVFLAAWWLQGTLLDLTHTVREMNQKMDALALRVDGMWSVADMRAWAKLLEARNPGKIEVPPVDRR